MNWSSIVTTRRRIGWLVFIIVFAIIVTVIAATSLYSPAHSTRSTGSQGGATETPDIVFPVKISVVHRQPLVQYLPVSGIVRSYREVDLISRIPGTVESVFVANGRTVRKGDLLVTFEDREYRYAYQRAFSLLLYAQVEYWNLNNSPVLSPTDTSELRAKVRSAYEKLERAREQFAKGEISSSGYERILRDCETEIAISQSNRSDVYAGKSGLAAAKEAYEKSKLDLDGTRIRAPFNAEVADCNLSVGERIQSQAALAKLIDNSKYYVDVMMLENELRKVRTHAGAEISVPSAPELLFTGRVIEINPIIDPKTRLNKVTIELDPRPHVIAGDTKPAAESAALRPGLFVRVKIETERFAGVLAVPRSAVLTRDQRPIVLAYGQGLAKWRYVTLGKENEEFIEISEGISEGDTILVDGHYTLSHDARVQIAQ